jgi:hypothetical protein
MHVQAYLVLLHRVVLLLVWGPIGDDPVARRERYRGGAQPVFIDTTSSTSASVRGPTCSVAAR